MRATLVMRTGTPHALLTPPTSSFPPNRLSGTSGMSVGPAAIARRMRSARSAELGWSSETLVLGCADAPENDRGRCKLAVTAHHSVIYAPSVSGRFCGWVREGRASDCGGTHRRVSPSLCIQ